jgi:hypothetical protein
MAHSRPRVRLRQLAVRNNCTVDWNGMRGDDAARFCGSCKNTVYNLSAMSEQAVEELIDRSEGICVRYYYRPDGTIVTSACGPTTRRSSSVAAAGVAGALVYTSAFVGISAALDGTAATGAMRDEGVKLAMGMKLTIKPRMQRERERREREIQHLAISDMTPNLPPAEEAEPALDFQMPGQPVVAVAPVWLVASLLVLGLVLAVLLSSWLALGVVPLGAVISLGRKQR